MTVQEIKQISDNYNELDKLIYNYFFDKITENYDIDNVKRCQYKIWNFSKKWDNEICITYLNPSLEYDVMYLTFEELESYSKNIL